MTNDNLFVSMEVSKAEFVVACYDEQRPVTSLLSNATQISRWLHTLPVHSRIGTEATGTYHGLLADLAVAAGHTVYVLNPRAVAQYLKNLNSRGKTDVRDARGIARFVRNE